MHAHLSRLLAFALLLVSVVAHGQDATGLSLDAGQDWRTSGLLMRAPNDNAQLAPGDRYRFDTWRLSVRYSLFDTERSQLSLGMTARSAWQADRPESPAFSDSPLLHAHGEYRLSPRWHLVGEVDAAGIRPGRDLGLGLQVAYAVTHGWHIAAGYRLQDQTPGDEAPSFANASWFTLGTRLDF
ncbi:hypothetical protein [Niveibacterium sp. SC-1]|uniref:hypothetical protein n=1 Tax=Niveibacterium sp. SC-1 TaxID=3135646 RepID=UPI00311DE6B3